MKLKNIVIISSTLSNNLYNHWQSISSNKSVGSSQHYYQSLLNGLKRIDSIDVSCISIAPLTNNKLFQHIDSEKEDSIDYYYSNNINFPILNGLFSSISLKKHLKKLNLDKNNSIIIFDSIMLEASFCLKYSLKKGFKTIGLTLDLPDIINKTSSKKGFSRIIENMYFNKSNRMLSKFDSYIFLTEYMNKHCNKKNKPYIIIDCIARDITECKKEKINDKPVVFYGGILCKEYGLDKLIGACNFLRGICDIWLYGECEFKNEIPDLLKNNKNLVIHDVISQDELHRLESNSAILINPRPIEEFTYYSFPSKTIEYMQMGVPVLMYKLPCLSKEYDDLLFYIKGNTSKDIADSIINVLNQDKQHILELTKKAKDFVNENKTNAIQAKKIVDFAESIIQ